MTEENDERTNFTNFADCVRDVVPSRESYKTAFGLTPKRGVRGKWHYLNEWNVALCNPYLKFNQKDVLVEEEFIGVDWKKIDVFTVCASCATKLIKMEKYRLDGDNLVKVE
jgi:hypothetical protein